MKRNTIVLLTCLLIAVLTTNYGNPSAIDYLGITATIIIVIALILSLMNYISKRKDSNEK